MITPRATRLVRVPDLQVFRDAVVSLACEGQPVDIRDRLLVVPTHAAAAHLIRSIEDAWLARQAAVVLPDFATPSEMIDCLAERLPAAPLRLTPAGREVLLGVAARRARDAGAEPPFRLRPALVAEMLRFYDALRLNGKDVDAFERLALGILEPGAAHDRGARRLVRQTRFLAESYREFERLCSAAGGDSHGVREDLLATTPERPVRHIVVTVTDAAFDPYGLLPAHWDLLARLPGLARLDIVVTDTVLAGGLHERLHGLLPGIDEVRLDSGSSARQAPRLLTDAEGNAVHIARDRAEEIAWFARRLKRMARSGEVPSLDRVALVVRRPLPYVYVTREVLRSAAIPCQFFDALPLAAEPHSSALDLVLSFVGSAFGRSSAVALLRSPHFGFVDEIGGAPAGLSRRQVADLDRALSEAGYEGEIEALERLLSAWREPAAHARLRRAAPAAEQMLQAARELAPLRAAAPAAAHLTTLATFLSAHERLPAPDDPYAPRQLRARAAILATIESLRDAYARFDDEPVPFEEVGALLRRWIEAQTFAPRTGEHGVHVVDAESARFGDFDLVHLAGLVEGEWPERPGRSIFYNGSILRELGWPGERDRIEGARAQFRDLLRLPARWLAVSAFTLEEDALVTPSSLVDDVAGSGLETCAIEIPPVRMFEHEALAFAPADDRPLSAFARAWLEHRIAVHAAGDGRCRGMTAPHHGAAFSLGALERYQDCPFKFFAADVLRLEEAPSDERTMSPRAHGRFVHEVFQRFFAAWDLQGRGAISAETLDAARRVFDDVAGPLLAQMPEAEAALARARLFGSAISLGLVDIVLELEASRPVDVRERWLEHRLEGEFDLGGADGRRVALRGVADRIDLLSGNRLRVIDYKSGASPNPRRALQVPVYALCAQERLAARDGSRWTVDSAAYVAFGARRPLVTVVKSSADAGETLAAARSRVFAAVDAIGRGEFPPRPYDAAICRSCAYSTVCRKDYVSDD